MRLETEIALQFALSMLETFSRQDFGLVLAGVRQTKSGREMDRLLERWRREQIITRTGRGRNARFNVTDKVRKRSQAVDPSVEWGRHWDGKWRVFGFDLPMNRRSDREKVWRHLRAARFGFLQQSVWIWPHDVEQFLREMVDAKGIPECFCGFEAGRLFLCDSTEVVASAWNWEQIQHDHTVYLRQAAGTLRALRRAERLEDLTGIARREYETWREAFRRDPFLPRSLWPDGYDGPLVQQRHFDVQAGLRERISKLSSS